MKIHPFSKLTDINPETIRMYRKRGFLHPKKEENGYFDYSLEDFASIVHLRKMRELSLSLDDIYQQQFTTNSQEYLDIFDERSKRLDEEIHMLQQRISYLELEKQHISNVLSSSSNTVKIAQSTDVKYDFYDAQSIADLHALFSSTYLTTTVTLRISKDILNGEIRDETIPLEVGLGTYKFMLDEKNITIPSSAHRIPNGKFITQMISLENLSQMNLFTLQPMMQYAKDIHKPFISDTTAYLAYITHKDNVRHYIFRIRACIEENDSPSYKEIFPDKK